MGIRVKEKEDSIFELKCPKCIAGTITGATGKRDFLKHAKKGMIERGHIYKNGKFFCKDCKIKMEWKKSDTCTVYGGFCDSCSKSAPCLGFKTLKQYISYLEVMCHWSVGEKRVICSECRKKRFRKMMEKSDAYM